MKARSQPFRPRPTKPARPVRRFSLWPAARLLTAVALVAAAVAAVGVSDWLSNDPWIVVAAIIAGALLLIGAARIGLGGRQ